MAYIKREDVLKHKRKMSSADFGGEFWDEAVLCEDICKIPTADVVEVVNCENCQYYHQGVITRCTNPNGLKSPSDDAYCSYGKRNEEKEK